MQLFENGMIEPISFQNQFPAEKLTRDAFISINRTGFAIVRYQLFTHIKNSKAELNVSGLSQLQLADATRNAMGRMQEAKIEAYGIVTGEQNLESYKVNEYLQKAYLTLLTEQSEQPQSIAESITVLLKEHMTYITLIIKGESSKVPGLDQDPRQTT